MKRAAIIIGVAIGLAGTAWAQKDSQGADTPAPETASQSAETDLANGTAFGDWVVACEAASVKRTSCRLVQTLTLRDRNELVARFIAVPGEDGAVLVAQTPMGVYLPGGAVYRFAGDEEAEQREMVWQSCQGQLCEAAAPLDADELAAIDAAETLLFGYRLTADADPIVVEVDVSEFNEGLDALKAAQAN